MREQPRPSSKMRLSGIGSTECFHGLTIGGASGVEQYNGYCTAAMLTSGFETAASCPPSAQLASAQRDPTSDSCICLACVHLTREVPSEVRRSAEEGCLMFRGLPQARTALTVSLHCRWPGVGSGPGAHHPRERQDRLPGAPPAHGDGAVRHRRRREDGQPGHGQVRDGHQQGERRGRRRDGRCAGKPRHLVLPVGGTSSARRLMFTAVPVCLPCM